MAELPNRHADRWERRLSRAGILEKNVACAREMLHFYREIIGFQRALERSLISESYRARAGCERPCPEELDVRDLLPTFQRWLEFLVSTAPAAMAQTARDLVVLTREQWTQLLSRVWRERRVGREEPALNSLIAFAFLQPVAEYLAAGFSVDEKVFCGATCPFCGRKPAVGALRPEGDGGKRWLICSLCAFEWQYRRIVCAQCGEEDVEKLPVYTSEEFPQVRVEACDTCKVFLKTVDLTVNGNADPVVDELASIPLTLWARQAGYSKLQCNVMGE